MAEKPITPEQKSLLKRIINLIAQIFLGKNKKNKNDVQTEQNTKN